MGYRTYIEDVQIFGNGEGYKLWFDFLKAEGIEVSEEGFYDGYITNVMGALETIDKIIFQLEEERRKLINMYKCDKDNIDAPRSLFDFTDKFDFILKEKKFDHDHTYDNSLTDLMFEAKKYGYAFMGCTFLEACKEKIEREEPFSTPGHFNCYKIKENEKIHVYAN